MLVTIIDDRQRGIDGNGKKYKIEGAEITRESGAKVFYAKNTSFYKAAYPDGTQHQGYLNEVGKLVMN